MSVRGQDAALRHEVAQGRQRVGGGERLGRQVGREVVTPTGRRLDRGHAVADGQQAPRADAHEGVAAQPLAALDGLEQEGRAAVVEAHEGADRGLEVGAAGGRQQDRVGRAGQLPDLAKTERIFECHVRCGASGSAAPAPRPPRPVQARRRIAGNQNDLSSLGRKVEPSAVPPAFGNCRSLADGSGSRARWRDSRRSVLPCIAGALRRSLLANPGSSRFGPEAHGSIHSVRRPSLHQPLVLYAGAGSYSSRSQPVFECGAESRRRYRGVSRHDALRDPPTSRRSGGPGT